MLSAAVIALLVLAFALVAGAAVLVIWRLWSSAGADAEALGRDVVSTPPATDGVSA